MTTTAPTAPASSRLAVLGLGAMGTRLARNYLEAGYEVTVWNRTPETAESFASSHGATAVATPRQAAAGADVVVSMVTNDQAAADIWLEPRNGALAAMPPGAMAIESSTITPAMARSLGAAAVDADLRFLEAPVVGSRPQAEAGALFYLLGGDPEAVELAAPIIDINAGTIRHVGDVGTAATVKLAINGLFGVQVAAYAEVVGMLAASDVDTDVALDILHHLPITSPGLQRILGLITSRDFAPNFPIELVAKDFGYLTALADDIGADLPVTDAAASVYHSAAEGSERDVDIAGIAGRYL